MTTSERRQRADALLTASAAPGRRWFVLSGTLTTLETVCSIARWGALAWTAQGVLSHSTAQAAQGVAGFVAASTLALTTRWAAGGLRRHGARAVADSLRRRLTEALLPATRRRRDTDPAKAALTMVDLVDDIADYHAETAPLRHSAPLSVAVLLAATAVLHWPSAVVVVATSTLLPLNMRLAGLFAQQGADRQLAATQRLNAVILDSFRGLRTLRELGAVDRRGRTLTEAAGQLSSATMRVLRRAFLSSMIMDVVITFSIAVNATYIGLSLLGYVHVPQAPALSLFTGLLVLLLCPMYFAPMRSLAAAFHQRERAITAAGTIGDIVSDMPAETAGMDGPRLSGPVGVCLDMVRFRYPGADHDTISADLTIAPGSWTVITGPSGAGKSTLLSLIAGLREPSAGQIRWTTGSDRQHPVLGASAWIGQKTVLLDATIRDNIRLGHPDATEQQIQEAIDAAGVRPVLERLPRGLDTQLGENGWGVSTGEARRIAIARAFLRGTRLWLLDEPTAHLDADSERAVIEALRRATHECTVVIATHSFALADEADTVLIIEDGRLHQPSLAGAR